MISEGDSIYRFVPLLKFSPNENFTLVKSYSNFYTAWNDISRLCPPLSLVIFDKMMLKKSKNKLEWIPMLLLINKEDFQFIHMLAWYNLLNVTLEEPVLKLFTFLARWLYKVLNEGQPSTEQDVWKWILEISQKEWEEKLKESCNSLCQLISEILNEQTINSKRIPDIINTKQENYRELLDAWESVELRIEPFILKALGYKEKISYLLKSKFEDFCPGIDMKKMEACYYGIRSIFDEIETTPLKIPQFKPFTDKEEFKGFGPSNRSKNEIVVLGDARLKKDLPDINQNDIQNDIQNDTQNDSQNRLFAFFIKEPIEYGVQDPIIAYILHEACFYSDQDDNGNEKRPFEKFGAWLTLILRSPLAEEIKQFILKRTQGRVMEAFKDQGIMSNIVAYSLISACPDEM